MQRNEIKLWKWLKKILVGQHFEMMYCHRYSFVCVCVCEIAFESFQRNLPISSQDLNHSSDPLSSKFISQEFITYVDQQNFLLLIGVRVKNVYVFVLYTQSPSPNICVMTTPTTTTTPPLTLLSLLML